VKSAATFQSEFFPFSTGKAYNIETALEHVTHVLNKKIIVA
jgi:hypothetical protein